MSKELEALKIIKIKCHPNSNPSPTVDEALGVIEQALQRLEAIDNANSNEVMECSLKLYKMVESAGNGKGFSLNVAWEYHNTIKQTLLKAQEQEKVLSIIFEKEVDIDVLRVASSVEHYNNVQDLKKLTQEEFDLLKRYCDKKDKSEKDE